MVNCSIDYMEQTQLSDLNPANILDAEGIKKIAYLTAAQMEEANKIEREKELTIKRQDTETEKQKLELDLEIETERGKQKREIETHQFRERAETAKVEEEERLKASQARILTEEKAAVARQQSLLQTNKAQYEREMANLEEQAQLERIRDQTAQKRDRDAALALIERERATIEQQKVVEAEKNSLTLVRQKQKDAEALAQADLEKKIAILKAEEEAQVELKEAESAAKRQEIDSKTAEMVAQQQATALKLLASAKAEEAAAAGLGEVQVIKAKLQVETEGIQARHTADANGLREKAEALKLLDKGGQAHEEFKMRLEADHSVALAQLETQKLVAREQAIVLAEALKHAKIDIVGGEAAFLERVVSLVGHGKAIDSMMQSSSALRDVKDTFFKGDHQQFRSALRSLVSQLTLDAKDLKDVTIAAAIGTLLSKSKDEETTQKLTDLLTTASRAGLVSQPVHSLLHSDHH
jgi:uncharacterized membrane protein YqiK